MAKGGNDDSDADSRTVTRTLGIALVAVIVVVAAGAVGVFVLDIGGGDSGPPSTSFETSEEMKTWSEQVGNGFDTKAPQIGITAASGEALRVSNTRITLDGRPNVWGLQDGEVTQPNKWIALVEPEPDICSALGSEETVTWDTGQSQYVMVATSRSFDGNLDQYGDLPVAPAHSELDSITSNEASLTDGTSEPLNGCEKVTGTNRKGGALRLMFSESAEFGDARVAFGSFTHMATKGSTVEVRWRAASGGETQTLSTYEVQQAPEKPSLE